MARKKYIDVIKDHHLIASFLHPNFKRFKFISDPDARQQDLFKTKSLIRQKIADLIDDTIIEIPHKKPKNSSIYDVDSEEEAENDNEIEEYFNMKVNAQYKNVLDFWKDTPFKRLQKIALEVYSVPASSAASERAFSISGKILRKERSRINPETLSIMSIVANNRKNKTFDL